MEASQETSQPAVTEPETEKTLAGPTAKEMAAAEEQNAARLQLQAKAEQERAELDHAQPVSIIGLAAMGHAELHDAMRAHQNQKKPEYTPPPRTERQMAALQEELEAGRRTQQKAEAQQASRPVERPEPLKEGFTTPVYRPDNMVPDPMLGLGKHGNGVLGPIKGDAQ